MMNRPNPTTEVLLLVAGAFGGRAGLAALVAAIAALASVPGLAFPHMGWFRASAGHAQATASGELGFASLGTGDIGAPFPAPVTAIIKQRLELDNLEGKPSAADVRRARGVNRKASRRLAGNPYFRIYRIAKRRFDVSWYLLASVHYQKRNAAAHPRAAASAVRSGLFRKGLGSTAAWERRRHAYRGIWRPRRYPHRTRTHPSIHDDFDVIMAAAAELKVAGARGLGRDAWQAIYAFYGRDALAASYATLVLERARAWRGLGIVPLPGSGELASPVVGSVPGCGYFHCPRPGHLHNGLDFSAPAGTPIHAADAGTVALMQGVEQSGGYGNFVCIQHRSHLATCYAHMAAFAAELAVGTQVARGEVIGLVGSTGHSTGPHLHFEVRQGPASCIRCAVDPAPYLSGEVPQAPLPLFDRAAAESEDGDRRNESGPGATLRGPARGGGGRRWR
jgi:murein DD-endopeptidase MepM/ murein hydrolase activator NlpD